MQLIYSFLLPVLVTAEEMKCHTTSDTMADHPYQTDVNQGARVPPRYICKYCSKPFLYLSGYRNHMYKHTGERNFSCHLCQKNFVRIWVLKRHMDTVHPGFE